MRGTRPLQKIWKTSRRLAEAAPGGVKPTPGGLSMRFSSSQVVVNEYKAASPSSDNTNKTTAAFLNNAEIAETTALVDNLLAYTRQLMDAPSKNNHYVPVRHVVAFSGGIDSSLVLALLETSKMEPMDSIHAVIGRSSAVPQDQMALARQVAEHIGTPLVEVDTTEGTDEIYIANNGQACLACKTHLYSALEAVSEHAATGGSTSQHLHQLYNGTNADDVQDSTRVGLIAARNFHVQSPLVNTTKANVRRAAKHLGLPNWNVAASPCLRSRLALGVQATQDHLQRIEAAEFFVRRQLNEVLSETSNLRVRLLAGNRAMLEVDAEVLSDVESRLSSGGWQNYFVQTLDFASIRARAFRSGSVAANTEPTVDGLQEKVAV